MLCTSWTGQVWDRQKSSRKGPEVSTSESEHFRKQALQKASTTEREHFQKQAGSPSRKHMLHIFQRASNSESSCNNIVSKYSVKGC